MSRIEISMMEYNALKEKVKNLERSLVDTNDEKLLYKGKYDEMRILVDEIKDMPLLERIFGWKKVVEQIEEL